MILIPQSNRPPSLINVQEEGACHVIRTCSQEFASGPFRLEAESDPTFAPVKTALGFLSKA